MELKWSNKPIFNVNKQVELKEILTSNSKKSQGQQISTNPFRQA